MDQTSRDRARGLGAVALAGGATAYGAVALINPYAGTEGQVAVARTAASGLVTYSLLWFLSSLLLVAGVVTVVSRIHGRGRTLTLVAGTIAIASSVAGAAIAALESVPVSLASALPHDADLAAALESFETSVVLSVVFALWLLGALIGFPMLVGGAARAGVLSTWYVVPVALAMAGQVLPWASSTAATLVLVVAFVAPLVVLAARLHRGHALGTGAVDHRPEAPTPVAGAAAS